MQKTNINIIRHDVLFTLWWTNIAMENHHFSWENPLQMTIFNSYVKLPEGTRYYENAYDSPWYSFNIFGPSPQEYPIPLVGACDPAPGSDKHLLESTKVFHMF